VTSLAATTQGFEETIAGVLDVLKRFVGYDLATVLLLDEQTSYVAVANESSQEHFTEFIGAAADAAAAASSQEVAVGGLDLRVADPDGLLSQDEDARMATFLSMPLKGHAGRVIGVLALASARKNAFGETALATLRLIDGPAAIVIDNARLAGVHTA